MNKNRSTFISLIAILVLVAVACNSSSTLPTIAVLPTLPPPTATMAPSATSAPTATIPLAPTASPLPMATATTAPITNGTEFAWNYLADQTSGNVKVQIARLVIADKTAINQDFTDGGLVTIFNDKPVVAEVIFIVTNNSDKPISIYPDQGKVIAGSEQIDLTDFMMGTEFGEKFSGDIYPGVKAIGGMWFGFKRTALVDIQKMTITFMGPSDQSLNRLGPDYTFQLDLSQRQDAAIPTELK